MKPRLAHCICLLGLLVPHHLNSNRLLADDPQVLQAGACAVDITPVKLPVETAGSMTPHSTSKVHDRLFARCLVLDNGQTKLAMVVCDSCMIPRELFDKAKEAAAKATGISTSHILCSATHSHSAVCVARVFQSNVEMDYCELLQQKIAEGIAQAHQQREPARIGWALANNPQQVFNRRWFLRPGTPLNDPFGLGTDKVRMNPAANHPSLLKPAGPTDPGVPVLSVQARDGRPIAIWTNYSLHYVGGIPEGGLSGDYFGEFATQLTNLLNAIDSKPPLVAAMTNGTSADINNINFFEGRSGQKPFEQIRAVAADLARSAHNAYQRMEYVDWVKIAVAEEEVELGVRRPGESELARAKQILAAAGPPPWKDVKQIYANETLHMADYPASVKAKLQAIRIGDVGIATTPCETFVETGLAIKEESPLPLTFTVELANGYNGYLPTPEQHALGGYETWRAKSSYLAIDAEPKVRSTLLRMLKSLMNSSDSTAATNKTSVESKAASDALSKDALSKIESTRGGRHWIDQPTALPKSPEESLACFQVEPGLRIELVAAEPLVYDPVWLAFDAQGRLFVAEYSDYPSGPADASVGPLSKIVMLEDADGDGRMDRRHLFADKLEFAHSFMPFRDGLLVGAKTEILYLRDSDGDHRADVREVVFKGFKPAHPQMQIGCPVWGMDNWIYLTYGTGEVERLATSIGSPQSSKPVQVRRDFRFHPTSWEFGPSSGFGQFGHALDSVGHRFICTNRNPIIAAPILPGEYQRNPAVVFASDQYDVAPSGGDSQVYPLVEMKSNYLSHAGTHTAACGTTAYVGDLLGDQFVDNVMVCEPIGHLITRSIIEPSGSTLKGRRARPQAEFVASTDTWFRPASLANGPDGALYIADMYRLWVEHPKFLPPDIAARIDWRAGEDRGRIWRIVPQTQTQPLPRFTPPQTSGELVQLLRSNNGWQRELAQRLIVERRMVEAEHDLRQLVHADSNRWAAQRALWTLDGLGKVTSLDVQKALSSKHANVRKDALRIARKFASDSTVASLVLAAAKDGNAEVQLECALTLGEFSSAGRSESQPNSAIDPAAVGKALALIAVSATNDDWLATAVLSSARYCGSAILSDLAKAAQAGTLPATSVSVRLIRELASGIGVQGNINDLRQLLHEIGTAESEARTRQTSLQQQQWWRYAALNGLAGGLPRNKAGGADQRNSLSALLSDPPLSLAEAVAPVAQLLQQATALAVDPQQADVDRVAAIEMLTYLPQEQWFSAAQQLFSTTQPVSVQLATLGQMRRSGSVELATLVLDKWPELGPVVRAESLLFLLQRKETTRLALEAMRQGSLSAAAINIDQRAILLSHPDAEIKSLAASVFGSGISPDRQEVARQYQAALYRQGDPKAGRVTFERICAACHRFNGLGHDVGPDISDTRNRSREALLFDILDPNQKLEPKYTAYQALTVDGALFQGVLVSESPEAVVLQLAEGKQQTIARSEIELFKANGKSLMPEGVEKDLTVDQMADLLAFLKDSP